jgi:hypothetical protein
MLHGSVLICLIVGVAADQGCSVDADGKSTCQSTDQTALLQGRVKLTKDDAQEVENQPSGSMMGGSMMGGSMMGGSMGPAPSPYRYRPAPSPSITQSDCATQCANTPCSDKSAGAGSHQILTCAQTCKMRILGETSVDCLGRCNRNGQSGCSLTVKGTTFGMCSASCTAGKSASQATSFINNDDCKRGCNVR